MCVRPSIHMGDKLYGFIAKYTWYFKNYTIIFEFLFYKIIAMFSA